MFIHPERANRDMVDRSFFRVKIIAPHEEGSSGNASHVAQPILTADVPGSHQETSGLNGERNGMFELVRHLPATGMNRLEERRSGWVCREADYSGVSVL
jgi:hypothetical protein